QCKVEACQAVNDFSSGDHTCNDLYIYVCVCVLEASVWKKKRVCVRMVPVDSVSTAVLDIRLTTKSKMMLQDMLGYVLWYMKGTFSTPPQAKPRSISLDMRKLSFDAAGPPLPLRPRSNVFYFLSAMDGVPFVLHPKFQTQSNGKVSNYSQLQTSNSNTTKHHIINLSLSIYRMYHSFICPFLSYPSYFVCY
uniref:Uncharacterized protein n=1 Tax=Astyanax mexicanus TaxID=7994 RepID=A0A8B9JDS5_ASTMX